MWRAHGKNRIPTITVPMAPMPFHHETVLMLKALLGLRLAIGRRLPFLQTFSDRGNSQPDHIQLGWTMAFLSSHQTEPESARGTRHSSGTPFTSHWTEHSSKYML